MTKYRIMIRPFLLSCLLIFASGFLSAQITIEDIYLTSGAEVAVEGCNDTLIIELNARVLQDTVAYNVLISGTADQSDYTIGLPDTLRFTDGQIRKTFPISFITDGMAEGAEDVRFNFVNLGSGDFALFRFDIYDEIPLDIQYSADTLCLRNTITLNGFGAGEYTWYDHDSTILQEGEVYEYFPQTRDTLFLRGEIHDCVKDTFIVFPFYEDELELNQEDTVFVCKGETTNLSVRSANGTVSWTSTIPNILSSTSGRSVTVDSEISSYVYAELNGENCTIRDTVYVRVDSLPEYTFIENIPPPDSNCNAYCPGELVTLSLNTTDPTRYPDAEFSWEPMNGTIQEGQMEQNVLISTRDTNYYVRTTTNNACESTDSIFVPVIDTVIQFNVRDTNICLANPRNSVRINITGPAGLSVSSWSASPGEDEEVEILDEDSLEVLITPQESGLNQYTVEGIVYSCCPTSSSVTINVEVEGIPINSDTTCPGVPVDINVDETALSDPQWIGNTDGLDCTNCFDNIATVNEERSFVLEAVDADGCIHREEHTVNVYESDINIETTVEPEGEEVAIGGTAIVEVTTDQTIDTNTITYTINGDPVEGSGPTVEIPILMEGENEVIITLIDENNCEVSTSLIIIGVAPVIEMPNAFTPNNDEVNDIFRPVITNAADANAAVDEFRIYNRWGEMVYQLDPESNETGWDGNYNGESAPPGVYLYHIIFRLPNGETETRKGDVTLIR